MMLPIELTERQIQQQIVDYLNARGIRCWKDRQGTTAPGHGTMRTSAGVSDIIGILPGTGRIVCIEVKRGKNMPSPKQIEFLDMVSHQGGIAFVARSIEDVQFELKKALTLR